MMKELAAVADHAAELADELDHHPVIIIASRRLELTIRTDDQDGITVLDLIFAARLEQWLRERGW
jgi:pterin-4a-carbinolamine dehydratase